MGTDLVYYTTGHGFGHLKRSAEVARELLALRQDVTIHFRTTAARFVVDEMKTPRATYTRVELDPGCVESDPLRIDLEKSAAAVRTSLEKLPALIEAERRFIAEHGIRLILADAPFFAGHIAEAAGVECWCITNFMWDWIYEPWFAGKSETRDLPSAARAGYEKMSTLLRMPFPGCSDAIRRVVEVPVVAGRSQLSRQETWRRAGLADDSRPKVLFSMRGGLPPESLLRAADESPDLLFVTTQDQPSGAPENLRVVKLSPGLSFGDLLFHADVVVAKLGYATLADCLAAQTALLWPARSFFREDLVTAAEVPRYLRMQQIAVQDYLAGRWKADVHALLRQQRPERVIGTDGAAVCAKLIAEKLS